MNKDFFKIISNKKGVVIFEPSSLDDIKRMSARLKSGGFPEIPNDYADFLLLSNGFYYNGLSFFGSLSHTRKQKNYEFYSLWDFNINFLEYEFFKDKLLIGHISESFIIFDKSTQVYSLIDGINLCSQIEFSDFNDLLKTMLKIVNIDY